MKRLSLLLTLFIAVCTASCSGGSSTPPPPPPNNGFSNTSLKGQYAFIMTGQAPDGFIARIGSFTADGNGGITGGLEVVRTATNALQVISLSASTYTVQTDGRGVVNLVNLTGTISFSITMASTTTGYISQTDGITGTSGTFDLQDTTAFTSTAINGPFVFNTSGLDPNGNVDSIVGQFTLNAGTIPTGVFDENDDATLSGATAITNGTYFLDSTNGSTVGLGQMTFAGFLYDFIIVNGKKIHLIEVPAQNSNLPITVGTANAQTAPPATNAGFTGSFVFMTSGIGTTSPDFKVGRFTADGTGVLTTNAIALDEKQLGSNIAQVPKGSISAATYSIDTANAGTGRGVATFTDSSLGVYSFVFYMTSATTGVIQDVSKGLIADGVIFAQTGAPFSNSSVAGDYAFNWNGTSTNTSTNATAEEDFVGHTNVTSAGIVTGTMDFSELNSNQGAFHNSALTGGLTIAGDGTTSSGNRNSLQVTAAGTNGGPSTTFNFTLYPVSASTMFVISQDKDHVTGGTYTRQITPP